jgi:hypothetical protein
MWRLALSFGRGRSGPRHRFLAAAGISIVVGVLLVWILLVWASWWLVLSAAEGAVMDTSEQRPASLVERAQFAGASIFGAGGDAYAAGDGAWQFATVGATATGVVFVTLAITYLVPVASAVAERRQLAQYVVSLGATPELLLIRTWGDDRFAGLAEHLTVLAPMVHLAAERHLTYPSLAYFHSGRDHASSSISMVVLDDAVTLLRHGVGDAFVTGDVEPSPTPDLEPLRKAGIPTVDDATVDDALAGEMDRRRLLAGLLANDGWTTEQWDRRRRAGQG